MQDVVNGPSVYEGAGRTLHSNETFTSNTYGEFTSFEANGFIVQFSSGSQYFNNSGRDYVAWNWKAGGTAVQNNDGTIQGANCQVSANTAAGFSIVKYTGNGTDGATVGHALSSAPEIIIIKNLDSSSTNWMVKVPSIMTDDKNYLYLNDDAAVQTTSSTTFIKTVNSSIFTLGTSSQTNSTNDFIAYCWHSVSGYSKIGGYAGSGNSQTIYVTNDGTSSGSGGFKPSWVIIKNRTAGSSNWMIYDAVRDTDGTLSEFLEANTPDQETTASSATITPISNGFTIGNSNSLHLNDSTDNYIYMAFK